MTKRFFRVMFGYDSLGNFYKVNFALVQFHKYSLESLESMMPFERKIFIDLLINYIESQEKN